ncbi:hypothetical protein SHIRM173S_13215 [Streptomyces hirsutus]
MWSSTARPAGSSATPPSWPDHRIITLLADPELRHRMGERGRAWVEQKWRWDLLELKTLL